MARSVISTSDSSDGMFCNRISEFRVWDRDSRLFDLDRFLFHYTVELIYELRTATPAELINQITVAVTVKLCYRIPHTSLIFSGSSYMILCASILQFPLLCSVGSYTAGGGGEIIPFARLLVWSRLCKDSLQPQTSENDRLQRVDLTPSDIVLNYVSEHGFRQDLGDPRVSSVVDGPSASPSSTCPYLS